IELLIKHLRNNENKSLSEKLEYFQTRLNDLLNIQLVVTFFIDKTLEYQAMIFSTINRTQKRVSQSLVYSLFGLDTDDTPQKTALEIVLRLNGHPKSPFYKRIKLYGASYNKNDTPPLSQATMVKSIVSLISENLRESENDRYKKRKELLKRSTNSIKFLPFRNYYATDRDSMISDI
ncbi:DGQHR domain-containing protein, partial [Chryseobacterium arthrosphaerae]